jgi:hypothetical protein
MKINFFKLTVGTTATKREQSLPTGRYNNISGEVNAAAYLQWP